MENIKPIPVPPYILKEKWNVEKQCWEESITQEEKIFLAKKKMEELEIVYITEKMKADGVYEDFIMYMDDKTVYDKEQRELEKERQEQYQKALEDNPELIYEDWLSQQPTYLPYLEEPKLTKALQNFMDKYL